MLILQEVKRGQVFVRWWEMPSLYYCLSVRAGCLLTSLWSFLYSLSNIAIASHHISGKLAVRVVCDSIQSKVVPELSALQQTNQTEIFSSATTSFNFLYKVYHKTGRTSLSSSSQSPLPYLDLIIHLLILLVNIGVLLSSPGLVLAVLKVVWRHWHGVSTINPRTSPGWVSPGSCLPWLLSSVTSPLTSGCWKRFSV